MAQFLSVGLFLLLLLFSPAAGEGVKDGLALALGTAIPALFPFFFLSSLLVSTGAAARLSRLFDPLMRILFSLPGAAAPALVLGLTGGYPVGAKTARELYDAGLLTRGETERLLAFCCNTGPGFLVGLCGGHILGSVRAGFFLWGVHAAAALLTGIALARTDEPARAVPRARSASVPFSACFVRSTEAAGLTALRVTCFILLFSCLLRLFRAVGLLARLCRPLAFFCPLLGLPEEGAEALALGLFELTNGLSALPGASARALLPAVSFLTSFGSLSVLCQSAAVLEGSGLPLRPLLCGKCLHALLSAALTTLLLGLLPIRLPAFAPAAAMPTVSPIGILLLFFMILLPFGSGKSDRHSV